MATEQADYYNIGQPVVLEAEFTDLNGTPTDPTTVTVTVTKPDGSTATPSAVSVTTGKWRAIYSPAIPGDHWYRFASAGPVTTVQEGFFYVRKAGAPTGTELTSVGRALQELDRLGIELLAEEDQLHSLIVEFSDAIADYTQRQFLPKQPASDLDPVVTKTFHYSGRGIVDFAPWELRSVDTITVWTDLPTSYRRALLNASSTVESEYRLKPSGQTPEGTYLWAVMPEWLERGTTARTFGRELTISGRWGIGYVPASVERACLIAVTDAFQNPGAAASRQIGPLGIVEVPETTPGGGRALPYESRALLQPFVRMSA